MERTLYNYKSSALYEERAAMGIVPAVQVVGWWVSQSKKGGVIMWKNRSVSMKLVKDQPTVIDNRPPMDFTKVANTVTRSVIAVMVTYVGVDTLRRVIVYTASAKI